MVRFDLKYGLDVSFYDVITVLFDAFFSFDAICYQGY